MGLLDRTRSSLRLGLALSRLAPHVPEIMKGGRGSAALMLERAAVEHGSRQALRYRDERHTWAEVNAAANRWARWFLHHGVTRGDVVALVMDNRPDFVFALLGLGKIRAVVACVNSNLAGTPLAHAIGVARPRLVLSGSEHGEAVRGALDGRGEPAPRVYVHRDAEGDWTGATVNAEVTAESGLDLGGLDPDTSEPMAYLYTSGTTGLPKAAIVTNQRFVAAAYGFGKILHEATAEDVIYVALPLHHGTGQWGGLGACLATGACLALRRRFSASAFWEDVRRFDATRFTYIGELCRYLTHQPPSPAEHTHRVRVAVGNGLRPDVWRLFQARTGIPMIREFYGATEGNAPLANLEGRPGMIGRLGFGQAVLACDAETGALARDARGRGARVERAGETGLLAARISRLATFDGYVDPAATERKILRDVLRGGDAWFDTGDLVTVHEDGWLSFADRVGDTFRWKGENVSTTEVAGALHLAPSVLEANVYGVIVPGRDGRAGMAYLRVSDGFAMDAFAAHVTRELPKYARPLFVRIGSRMETTATFKHKKADYRAEGFDPRVVRDPLFVLVGGRYEPLDVARFEAIEKGRLEPGEPPGAVSAR